MVANRNKTRAYMSLGTRAPQAERAPTSPARPRTTAYAPVGDFAGEDDEDVGVTRLYRSPQTLEPPAPPAPTRTRSGTIVARAAPRRTAVPRDHAAPTSRLERLLTGPRTTAPSTGGILVMARCSAMRWWLRGRRPVLSIGGLPGAMSLAWNRPTFVPLRSGAYPLQLHVPGWFGPSHVVQGTVRVHAGKAEPLLYRPGALGLHPGRLDRVHPSLLALASA